MEITRLTKCRAPLTTLTRYVVSTILAVAVSNMNNEAQWPGVVLGSRY